MVVDKWLFSESGVVKLWQRRLAFVRALQSRSYVCSYKMRTDVGPRIKHNPYCVNIQVNGSVPAKQLVIMKL